MFFLFIFPISGRRPETHSVAGQRGLNRNGFWTCCIYSPAGPTGAARVLQGHRASNAFRQKEGLPGWVF